MEPDPENEPFFEFTWSIPNFSLYRNKPGDFLDSPTFVVQILRNTEWHMRLRPEESDASVADTTSTNRVVNIVCFLHRTNCGVVSGIGVKYSICLDNSNCENQQSFLKGSIFNKAVKVSRARYMRKVVSGKPDNLKVICRLSPTQWQAVAAGCVAHAPYPPVCCSVVTTVPTERRKICWRIADFNSLPSQHEVAIPVVSASPDSPKLLVTLSWSDESTKEGGGLKLEIREMPELVGKTFKLSVKVHLVKGNSVRCQLVSRDWFIFRTVRKNYWLFVKTYSDSVWNLCLGIDRERLRNITNQLQDGALVLECDFVLSYEPVASSVVSSGYVHTEPSLRGVDETDHPVSWVHSFHELKLVILRIFNDQTRIFKFFFMLIVFLAVFSRVFKDSE